MTDREWREFWITFYPNGGDAKAFGRPCHDDLKHLISNEIHVIEKAAYDALQAENEKLKKQVERLRVKVEGMILSLQKHGTNINVMFHIGWLNEALSETEEE